MILFSLFCLNPDFHDIMMTMIRSTEIEVKYHGNLLIIGICGSDNEFCMCHSYPIISLLICYIISKKFNRTSVKINIQNININTQIYDK